MATGPEAVVTSGTGRANWDYNGAEQRLELPMGERAPQMTPGKIGVEDDDDVLVELACRENPGT